MYICAEVDDFGACSVWSEYFGLLPPLSTSDALEIASLAFTVWAIAWAARQIAGLFVNR